MRLFHAVVQVPHDHGGVLRELHHQPLRLLQLPKLSRIQFVRVMEKQVVLAGELDAQPRVRPFRADGEDPHLDRLQRAHFLRLLGTGRRPQLERHLALVKHPVAVRQARVSVVAAREVQRRLQRGHEVPVRRPAGRRDGRDERRGKRRTVSEEANARGHGLGRARVRVAGKSGMQPPTQTNSTDFASRPGLMGARGRRPPLAGGERAETYMMRSPCDGRATGCARARAFAGPQHERLSAKRNSRKGLPPGGRERHFSSRILALGGDVLDFISHVVLRGSLLRARWRWWGRPHVGGGRRWDPYRNAGSAGTRLGLHEGALLRRDCRSSRGGFARATSIRRRHFARRARTGTALETRNSARGVTWMT